MFEVPGGKCGGPVPSDMYTCRAKTQVDYIPKPSKMKHMHNSHINSDLTLGKETFILL